MKTQNSYQLIPYRIKGLIFAMIFFILMLIGGLVNAQKPMGFAGASVLVTPEIEWGGGIEIAAIKTSVGFGIQAEYTPILSDTLSSTSARGLLIWKITENFSIRTAGGIEVQTLNKKRDEIFLSAGFGPMFTFSKIYLAIQPNIRLGEKTFDLSNVSFTIGMRFE